MDNHSARAGSGNPTWPRAGPKREFMNVACASCESQTSKTKKPPALTAKRWVAKGSRPHHNLALLLELAYKKLDAALIAQLRANGHSDLRPAHSQVFGAIPAEGARVGEMAAHAGITQQSMSELVDSLQRLGYLERRPDPQGPAGPDHRIHRTWLGGGPCWHRDRRPDRAGVGPAHRCRAGRGGAVGPRGHHAQRERRRLTVCGPQTQSILTGGHERRVRFIEPPSPPRCDASRQQSPCGPPPPRSPSG